MPHNAEELIRATRTLNEQNRYAKPQNISPPVSSDEEAVLGPEVKASTPVNTEFKKRLESIFASPIRKPDQVSKAAMDFKAPIPMPRKRRVMFNQPETKLSLSGTESDNNLP